MKSIGIEKIIVHAVCGSSIDQCINEAITLAFERYETVELIHNDTVFEISPVKIKSAIINDYGV